MSDSGLTVDLTHQAGDFRLRAEAEFPDQGVTALLGPNGAGKSTLLRLIAGFDRPRDGEIVWRGSPWFSSTGGICLKAWQRPAGIVFQDGGLLAHLSVAGNLAYARRRAAGGSPAYDDIVEAYNLGDLLDARPDTLSGGERQRVALARTLLTRPEILLLDEPLAAIDRQRRPAMLAFLKETLRRFDIPAILVSHSIDEVLAIAGHAVLMEDGQITTQGNVDAVLARHEAGTGHAMTRAGTVLTARITGQDTGYGLSEIDLGGQTLWLPLIAGGQAGEAIRVRIIDRDVALALEAPRAISVRNILSGTIVSIQQDPAAAFGTVAVNAGGQILHAQVTRAAIDALSLTEGQPVYALVKSVSFEGRNP